MQAEHAIRMCRRCGTRSPHDQKFCKSCGKELGGKMALDEYLTPAAPSQIAAAQREKDMTQSLAYQHFLRAKQFIKQKNLLFAIREFERALEIHPEDPMVRRLLQKTREAHTRFGVKPAAVPVPEVKPAPAPAPAPLPAPRAAASPLPLTTTPRPAASAGPSRAPAPAPRPVSSAASAYEHPPIPGPMARGTGASPATGAARPPLAPPVRPTPPTVAEAAGKRTPPAPGAKKAAPVAPQTGKFLEAYSKVPSMSLALLVEAETDDRAKELLVSFLILLGLFAFTTLLFV